MIVKQNLDIWFTKLYEMAILITSAPTKGLSYYQIPSHGLHKITYLDNETLNLCSNNTMLTYNLRYQNTPHQHGWYFKVNKVPEYDMQYSRPMTQLEIQINAYETDKEG